MNAISYHRSAGFCLLLAAIALTGCGGSPAVNSIWKDSFQQSSRWTPDVSTTYFKDNDIALDARNDSTSLYLTLSTTDRRSMITMLMFGMTIRIGRTEEGPAFSIHYPLGMQEVAGDYRPQRMMERLGGDGSKGNDTLLSGPVTEMLQKMELRGIGDGVRVAGRDTLPLHGITASVNDTLGQLFYHLVVPLRSLDAYGWGIGVTPGETIAMSITTGEPNQRGGSSVRDGSRSPGSGRGGGYGGRRGGGRGGDQDQRRSLSEPIKITVQVKLAADEAAVRKL